jgi:hypothetical protein
MKKGLLKNILIGADIELFLVHKKSGEVVSAEGFIKGTKDKPFNFDPANKYFATSLDNVEAEFCIPPVTDRKKFGEYIKKAVDYINSTIPKHLCTAALPSAILDDKWLQTEQAKLFGCEPDYCVWTRSMNEKPDAGNPNLRSAGGHIHIGYDEPTTDVNEALIKSMDLYVGVPSVLQEPDNERKLLYGKAGCFRFKDYGVEYRTISNYYLASEALTNWAFDSTMMAVNSVNNGFEINEKLGQRIVDTINNNDKKMAEKLVKEFKMELV